MDGLEELEGALVPGPLSSCDLCSAGAKMDNFLSKIRNSCRTAMRSWTLAISAYPVVSHRCHDLDVIYASILFYSKIVLRKSSIFPNTKSRIAKAPIIFFGVDRAMNRIMNIVASVSSNI
jgi:hypothetical protein